jgi:Tol biopolymer transport system component
LTAAVDARPHPALRVSVGNRGTQGNAGSFAPTLDRDGRFVGFASAASNLVPGDTNHARDVFVRDRKHAVTVRVSVAGDGTQANGHSGGPALSANGRVVAFWSTAANLVEHDTNGVRDIFVHDLANGETVRVSVGPSGAQANAPSRYAALSADGYVVAFRSDADNLVAGDTNATGDIFVHDRATGETTRVSVGRSDTQANGRSRDPSLSAHGDVVAFRSEASNLVAGDTNRRGDIFVYDRRQNRTTRVDVGPGGMQAAGCGATGCGCDPSLSADGRFVSFWSSATNLVPGDTNDAWDVFVRDRVKRLTTRISVGGASTQATRSSGEAPISANGRFVAFTSLASNLVAGDANGTWDVFVRDRWRAETSRLAGAREGNRLSDDPAISGDGRFVAFHSLASNVVDGDTNGAADVFVLPRRIGSRRS